MVEIKSYLNDGANWQAQCVLSYVRSHLDLPKSYNVEVGRYENCREQGYVFSLIKDYKQVLHIAVYEHRNMDSLVAKSFKGFFFNTPRAEDLPMKDKWDYDKSFDYGCVIDCGKYVVDTFEMEIKEIESIDMDVVNAIKDYNELNKFVEKYKGTFDELCVELGGYNKDKENYLFDVNFKSISTTIYHRTNGTFELNVYFDVWQADRVNPMYEKVTIDRLNEMCLNKN